MKPILLFFAILSPVFGRIGETPQECQKRYGGETLADPDGFLDRSKGDMRILIKFRGGKCVSIVYIKTEHGFTDEEVSKLQKANCEGPWVKTESPSPLLKTEQTADGLLQSDYMLEKKTLVFITKKEMAAIEKEEKEASEKALEGL